jgi:serine/threonine protein kinase
MTAQALHRYHQLLTSCIDLLAHVLYVCTCPVASYTANSHNVLITDGRRAVLTDFGLSKTASTISTMTNSKSSYSGGTLAWTAPEIFNETDTVSNFTAKSDVYSFGILIYEVLSGAFGSSMPW